MIVKTEDYYINLDNVKLFEIKKSEWDGGISIFCDGVEFSGGEEQDLQGDFWCDVVKIEFDIALSDDRKFFDMSKYLEDGETPFITTILDKYAGFKASHKDNKNCDCQNL